MKTVKLSSLSHIGHLVLYIHFNIPISLSTFELWMDSFVVVRFIARLRSETGNELPYYERGLPILDWTDYYVCFLL